MSKLNVPDDFWENSLWDDENHFWEEKYKEQFERTAQMPLSWLLMAEKLKRAADRLYSIGHSAMQRHIEMTVAEHEEWKQAGRPPQEPRELMGEEIEVMNDIDLISVSLMLYSFAIENMAKGILAKRSATPIKKHNNRHLKLDFDKRGHDLVFLVKDLCKLTITPDEEDMLQKLTKFGVWRGRYPTPLFSDGMKPPQSVSGTDEISLHVSSGRVGPDYELITSIYDHLVVAYKRKEAEA